MKTLSAAAAGSVNFSPVTDTVTQLAALAAPGALPQDTRIAPTELTVFSVTADVVEFKEEADRDIHVVIAEPGDPSQTMIVEFPDAADCKGAGESAHAGQMAAARAALVQAFGQPSSTHFTKIGGTATFTGVGFFDVPHGQTSVAPNAIELHPVIGFSTGAVVGTPGTATTPKAIATADTTTSAGVNFVSVVGAAPGGQASVSVQTSPNAACIITYTTPAGTKSSAQGLAPKTADAAGIVSWSWSIGASTKPGEGSVTVTCAGDTQSTDIEIG